MKSGLKRPAEMTAVLRELRRIPGVGPSIAQDIWNIGIRSVAELKGRDPDDLYAKSCDFAGCHIDRCLLYVYRCAVYFASNKRHDSELLKWWKWSDASLKQRRA
jgi:hypothetical protein